MLFRDAFLSTVQLIGLHAWNFTFHHRQLTKAYATVTRESDIRYADVKLASNMNMTHDEIIGSAVHEALHVLLADISDMALATFCDTVVTQQEEIIVNSLEKALSPIIKQRINYEP